MYSIILSDDVSTLLFAFYESEVEVEKYLSAVLH